MGSDRTDRYPPASSWERLPVTGLLIALGLSVASAGSLLAGSSLPGPGLRLVGANQPLNAGAANPLDLTAHNSPTVVRNPTDSANVVVANRIDTPSFSCALHVSKDDATTWEQTEIPFPPGEELPPRCFAPDVAFGADGTLYLSFVTLAGPGNTPNAVWLASSSDGGTTLSAPEHVLGPLAFQVRLAAHPHLAGQLHLTWLQASTAATLAFPQPANPILAARSNDGGAAWLPPVQVNTPSRQRVVAASSVVGTGDRVYVVYLDLRDDRLDYHGGHEGRGGPPYPGPWSLVLARSSDGGATWQESVVDDAVVPTERVIVFFPPAPSLAVDPHHGRVYVAFHDGRRGSADVWVWTSDDKGASFTAPVKVNDTGREDLPVPPQAGRRPGWAPRRRLLRPQGRPRRRDERGVAPVVVRSCTELRPTVEVVGCLVQLSSRLRERAGDARLG